MWWDWFLHLFPYIQYLEQQPVLLSLIVILPAIHVSLLRWSSCCVSPGREWFIVVSFQLFTQNLTNTFCRMYLVYLYNNIVPIAYIYVYILILRAALLTAVVMCALVYTYIMYYNSLSCDHETKWWQYLWNIAVDVFGGVPASTNCCTFNILNTAVVPSIQSRN